MDPLDLLLENLLYRFEALKQLGEGALAQVEEAELNRRLDEENNSIASIVQHLHGNMVSRWTDFLTTDGEKNRQRDAEFEEQGLGREALMARWEEGWRVTLGAIAGLEPEDLTRTVTIRGQELGVIDAVLRQLGHYAYHVGQLVTLARHWRGDAWQTLSIARGQSAAYQPVRRD